MDSLQFFSSSLQLLKNVGMQLQLQSTGPRAKITAASVRSKIIHTNNSDEEITKEIMSIKPEGVCISDTKLC
jgi:hypothetical protein